MDDHYKVLGVPETATDDEIKKAYRTLAKKWHPDSATGNAEQFRKISDAYEILGSSEKRTQYDQERKFGHSQRIHINTSGFGPGFGNPFGDFGDFMKRESSRARDVEVPYHITLEESFTGKETEITYTVPMAGRKTTKINIPAGIDTGTKVRYQGAAGATNSHVPGDLYVVVMVYPHARFKRDNDNLIYQAKIDVIDLILGTEIVVECIDGATIKLKVPPGSQPGPHIRVRGKGMPKPKTNERGDMYIDIVPVIPTSINERQREILQRYKSA